MGLSKAALKLSLRKQILGMSFIVFALFTSVLLFTSQKILTNSISHQFLAQANSVTELVSNKIKPEVLAENRQAIAATTEAFLELNQVQYIKVFSYDMPLVELHSSDYPPRLFRSDTSLLDASDGFYDTEYVFEVEGSAVGKVQLSFSSDRERAELTAANRKLAVSAVVMMGMGLWGIWLLAGKLSRRIKALEHASYHLSTGQEEISLPMEGEDEIAATGRAFQNMMWRIREKYEAINLSPDGILLVSANQRITHTNEALVTILGERASHLAGKPFAEFRRLLLDVLDRQAHRDIQSIDAILDVPEIKVEVPEVKILHCIRKCVGSPDGQSYSEVFYIRDVTQESEVDRMKSEFLTTAAHELRTPLASVMGFSELLMNNDYDVDKVKLIAETINRQSVNLKHLVDDLLDIARIEARGCDAVTLSLGTAKNVVDECCELITGDEPCELMYEKAQCVWPPVMLDESKIKQAVMNILTNAVKYSDENGLVIVDTILLVDEFDLSWFGIRVTDQGIGMTQEQLARVGEKFYRADDTGSRQGTGLGIALTSEILALHDGHIEITSQFGQGTQVTLWIPVAEHVEKQVSVG